MSRKILWALASVAAAAIASTTAWASGLNLDKDHVPGQLIVKFKDGNARAASVGILSGMGAKIRHEFRFSGALSIEFADAGDRALLQSRAAALSAMPEVEYVEANTILSISETVPNDADFGRLYGLLNNGQTGGTAGADIAATKAWDVTTGSRDVLVSVIDTGVDYDHPDIKDNYWTNPGESGLDAEGRDKRTNGVDDDGNGYVDDWRGWDFVNNDNDPKDDHDHGTHCAGTIGGVGNNGTGVAGVAWQVSLVGVKFLSASGSGTLENAVKAIEYTTSIGADMSSNSWGGGGFSPTMEAAIKAANDRDILFIAAAGNSGTNNDRSPHYPSSYAVDNVIAVAATDHNDRLASFSCWGPTSVHVAAPGVDIFSTRKASGYTSMSGTSMATPHVSGVAALIKSVYPSATVAEVRSRILNTVDPIASLDGKIATGGRVNAFNALENDSIPPGAARELEVAGAGLSSVDLRWLAAGDDGELGRATRYELRWAAAPIVDDATWAAATRGAVRLSIGADGVVTASLTELPFNTSGYVAVRAVDNVGNVGPVSQSVAFSTRAVRKIMENAVNTMDGITADRPWGLESVGGNSVLSDSPTGSYANDANVSATLEPIALDSGDVTLALDMFWDTEANYDFGHVEVSTDGATWQSVDKVSGRSNGFVRKSYDLRPLLAGATEFQLRFRLTSDYSITGDGFKVDNITLFAPAD